MPQSAAPIPCTIVTGFLGSGKTTIIRNILQNPGDRRFAIVVNEFGDTGLDGDIIRGCGISSCAEDDVIELANGCICCSVADDFEPALEKILARRPPVDHILIETSGLALPKPLVKAFQWPSIRARVSVDGVIAVADGKALADGRVADDMEALARQRATDDMIDHDDPVEEVFEDQLACADLIILSKTDLLSGAEQEAVTAQISRHLPRAVKIVPVANGRLHGSLVLGLDAKTEDDIDNRPSHHDGLGAHEHDDFETFAVDLAELAAPDQIAARVAAAGALPKVLRIKGFAVIAGKPMRLVVQGVGSRVSTHYDRAWGAAEKRMTRLVVIGLSGIRRADVERILTG